jgi:hypothetical protein
MNNKMKRLSLSGIGLGLLLACSPNLAPPSVSMEGVKVEKLSPMTQALIAEAKKQGHKDITVLDVGNGQKTAAAFNVSLKFTDGTNSNFATKASSSGVPASTVANKVEITLMEFDGAPPGTGALPPGNIKHTAILNKALTGCPTTCVQSFTFTNVLANANATSKYYVASRLIYENAAPLYRLNLIKPPSTPITLATGSVTGPIVLTDRGGSGNSGGVFVDPQFQINATDTGQLFLNAPMQLDDEKGASIDSRVNVTDGSSGIPGINVTSP